VPVAPLADRARVDAAPDRLVETWRWVRCVWPPAAVQDVAAAARPVAKRISRAPLPGLLALGVVTVVVAPTELLAWAGVVTVSAPDTTMMIAKPLLLAPCVNP